MKQYYMDIKAKNPYHENMGTLSWFGFEKRMQLHK